NNRPEEVFRLTPDELERAYGGSQFAEILAHNANRTAFFTIDLMGFRSQHRERYEDLIDSGDIEAHLHVAEMFQDMHQTGNSLATRARETASDDLSNGLFKIAHDALNSRDDWALPEYLERLAGAERRDALLTVFMHKRAARRTLGRAAPGSLEHTAA